MEVVGSGFMAGITTGCTFGMQQADVHSVRVLTSSLMHVRTPAARGVGRVDVRAAAVWAGLVGGSLEAGDEQFLYTAPVHAERLEPSTGPDSGGTVVRVYGSGFMQQAGSACRFGVTQAVVEAVVRSSTVVECTSPPHAPGNFSLIFSPKNCS